MKDNDYFDDCPICQALKKAEKEKKDLSKEEIMEAYKKAKKQGAIVGGKWFEEN